MTIGPELISILAIAISVVSLVISCVEAKAVSRQVKVDAFSRMVENNRELILLGMNNTELLRAISDETRTPDVEKRYLQLWLNHAFFIYIVKEARLLNPSQWKALSRDMRQLLSLRKMREHWQGVKECYDASFVEFVETTLAHNPTTPQASRIIKP